ncbi:DNA-binding protein [Hyphomicrobium sp. CS1GBMeth3]|uniref:DNA-binding protein n=1 Tax=Hyphomicrobium sp. CS1GBMeth3 TaxID=1892845 RepID=UPI000930226F|nr:DNA-binding protein [Hyphomicrobium sp. CS1GBMeth3]
MRIGDFEIDAERYYSDAEAGQAIGRTRSTLATDRCKRRGLPYTKLGRKVFYRGRDIIEFVERNRVVFVEHRK